MGIGAAKKREEERKEMEKKEDRGRDIKEEPSTNDMDGDA